MNTQRFLSCRTSASEKYSELIFIKTAMHKYTCTKTAINLWIGQTQTTAADHPAVALYFGKAICIHIVYASKDRNKYSNSLKGNAKIHTHVHSNQYFRIVCGIVNNSICSRSLWIKLNIQRGDTERNIVIIFIFFFTPQSVCILLWAYVRIR